MMRTGSAIVAVWGVFVIYGVYRRWSLFVNPPWLLVPLFGGFKDAKERHGEKLALRIWYTIGLGIVVLGSVVFFSLPRN
jgi:hypothetical protein